MLTTAEDPRDFLQDLPEVLSIYLPIHLLFEQRLKLRIFRLTQMLCKHFLQCSRNNFWSCVLAPNEKEEHN